VKAFKPSKQIILRTILLSIILLIFVFVYPIKSYELLCPASYLEMPGNPLGSAPSMPPEYIDCFNKTVYGGLIFIVILSYILSCLSITYIKKKD